MVHQRRETDNMRSNRIRRHIGALAGGAAVVAMVAVTAGCGSSGNQAPSTSTTTATTTPSTTPPPGTTPPATSPTENYINPTGGNLFTPPVRAPALPTQPPGAHGHHG
jgi:hypothetical protein